MICTRRFWCRSMTLNKFRSLPHSYSRILPVAVAASLCVRVCLYLFLSILSTNGNVFFLLAAYLFLLALLFLLLLLGILLFHWFFFSVFHSSTHAYTLDHVTFTVRRRQRQRWRWMGFDICFMYECVASKPFEFRISYSMWVQRISFDVFCLSITFDLRLLSAVFYTMVHLFHLILFYFFTSPISFSSVFYGRQRNKDTPSRKSQTHNT